MSPTGAAVLAAVLALVAGTAWQLQRSTGTRRPAGTGDGTAAVLVGLGARPEAAELTAVQFSTAFCGPCRATRARLQQLAATRPGLAYLDVDAESSLDAVRALDVRRTPTLFWLDRAGRVVARSSGAPRPAELTALVEEHLGAARPGGAR